MSADWNWQQRRRQAPQPSSGSYRSGSYYPASGVRPRTYPAPAAAQTRTDQPYIRWLFQRVDTDGNGCLDAVELQRALSNGAGTPFNFDTIKLIIGIFDKSRRGTISFSEFTGLWRYVGEWCDTFRRFDTDRSGNIDQGELQQCLTTYGYRLTDGFCAKLVSRFDRSRCGRLNFDDFVQLCVMLQTLTQSFKEKDTNRRGKIDVSYEEFLLMVFSSQI